jgi:uncharacterized surface protein with fasciclin (FAS1) repeats
MLTFPRFLTLPGLCTHTLSAIGLSSMMTSVNRTNSTDEWDSHPGLTCLSPSNEAFGKAGSPEITGSEDALNDVLDLHTIESAQYTSGLRDGQVLQSEAETSILVTIKNGTVYFNNAKVIRANVITKNGVIHVLDSVRWLTNAHIHAY